jgi:hypothetical protein
MKQGKMPKADLSLKLKVTTLMQKIKLKLGKTG